jgi:signal transduction histidine kinase
MKLRWRMLLGFTLKLSLFVVLMVVSYSTITKMLSAQELTIHTHQVIQRADAILIDLLNMETGERGFAISGKETFLEPLTLGVGAIQNDLEAIKSLTSDNSKQQVTLNKLHEQYQNWFQTEIQPLISIRNEAILGSRPPQAVYDFIDSEKGKTLMDAMRVTLSQIKQEEASLLEKRHASLKDLTDKTKNLIVYGGIAVIALGFFISIFTTLSVIRPMAETVAYAEQVSAGNYSAKLELKRGDEIGVMAAALRSMVSKLTDHIALLDDTSKKLEELNGELAAKNNELDDFAYIASHDLKEPLRGIHNNATFLLEDYGERLDEDGRSYLVEMKKLAERLSALISRLLAYSRLGRTELFKEIVDLEAVLDTVAKDLKPLITEKEVELRRPKRLPAVKCDPSRIGEVFQNLISNAMKYNDKPVRWVEVGYINNEKIGVFYVRDNGIGIPPQHQERIFKIFKRLHRQDLYGGGTGAGLTIVKKIVERHCGRIWLESVPGEGTTFYFTLTGDTNGPKSHDTDCGR